MGNFKPLLLRILTSIFTTTFIGIVDENVELKEVPKYKKRVEIYVKTLVESEDYLTTMEQLRDKVKQELDSKGQLQQLGDKVSNLLLTTKNKSAEVLAIEEPSKKIKSLFSNRKK